MSKLEQAIKSAASKEYKGFEKQITNNIENKMKDKLAGFMNYLEKNIFDDE